MSRKQAVMAFPQSGDGELFQLAPDEKAMEKLSVLIEDFCKFI